MTEFKVRSAIARRNIMHRYWYGRTMNILNYFPVHVHPDVFTVFKKDNLSFVYGSVHVHEFCSSCACVAPNIPRNHHAACIHYIDDDAYPKNTYVNPIGVCPDCGSDDGLSIDSSREMELSIISCSDCDFIYQRSCPEDKLLKLFKKFCKGKSNV